MNYNKPELELVMDLINLANGQNEKSADYAFDVPTEGTFPTRNSDIVLTAKSTAPVKGSQLFHYDRVAIQSVVDETDPQIEWEGETDVQQLVAKINEAMGIQLAVTDVISYPIEAGPQESQPISVPLSITPTQRVFMGSSIIKVVLVRPDISTLFTEPELSGFVYP